MSLGAPLDGSQDGDDHERERALEAEWETRGDSDVALLEVHDVGAPTAVAPGPGPGPGPGAAASRPDPARRDQTAVLGDMCSICLQPLVDAAMLRDCYHVFCFECISLWVQKLALHGVDTATCPLCKCAFQHVYCSVVSETEFEVFAFHGRTKVASVARDERMKQRELYATKIQRLQRRSIVYRNQMRLVRVNGVAVAVDAPFPSIVKLPGEYSAWMERELQACIGQDVNVTVLVTLIECCLEKVRKRPSTLTQQGYQELQLALAPFLYDDAACFVRELAFFLSCRLNMDAYDEVIEYCCGDASACSTKQCCVFADTNEDSAVA
ncbi:TPA: hypothetical protein N0F65_008568 [Lagenidium giganteum]|uniref:RING-type domain-containing protein n=1 Tax=Lagenidium giganteum TaxID=4803 RepID=A0AAV2YM87_9STRA|nr:TPA: hypothetical protein N0F65_008568 [Lagenidium giganteum]